MTLRQWIKRLTAAGLAVAAGVGLLVAIADESYNLGWEDAAVYFTTEPAPHAPAARPFKRPLSPDSVRVIIVAAEARRWGVDPELAVAVSRAENGNADPMARSSVGAFGWMQVMPAVWIGRFNRECGSSDLADGRVNACYGVLILKQYLAQCGDDVACALQLYNGASTRQRARPYLVAVAVGLAEGLD